ncbi:MAG: DnaJ C-terminal domain-containing protein [Aggregatilineales bacterium]
MSFVRYEPCARCWLEGCERCGGQGMVAEQAQVDIRLPPDIRSGMRLLVEGQGGVAEPGGPRGDLWVYVLIQPSQVNQPPMDVRTTALMKRE